ncbi:MAG: hypothetical protein WD009_05145 [Phycisphaeraceae bacterium]
MRYLITWIRGNPVTVAAIAVVAVSLVFFAYLLMQRGGFREELSQRSGEIGQIDRFIGRSVEIPPESPDAPSDQIRNVTITPGAIEQLDRLYARMNREYDEVLQFVTAFNRRDDVMYMGGLLPNASGSARRIAAREAYRAALEDMLQPPASNAPGPRIHAGAPPGGGELRDGLASFEQRFRDSRGGGSGLSNAEERELASERELYLRQLLQRRAQQIQLYAETDRRYDTFPFRLPEWTLSSETPEPQHLWEGQIELWILQDIVEAIGRANRIDRPGASVIDAPVKRLIRAEVVPGYVGLHTLGGLGASGDSRSRQSVRRPDGAYPAPFGGRTGSPDQRVSDNFHVGPTGRVSNALYDVRHARVEIVVASRRLPEVFRALSETNFMTVLSVTLNDVDEYEHLREGYVYGADDVVQAELVVETIWLRAWTERLMPSIVRQYVGIDEPGEELQTEERGEVMDEWQQMLLE